MEMMTRPGPAVTGGVDSHGDVHVVAAVCSLTHRLLGVASFPATVVGYVRLLEWLAGFGPIDRVGVEGTGAYGAGLARFLAAEDVEVVEVDRPDRAERRRRGKSDTVDAEAAARAVLSGRASGTPKSGNGLVEAIRAWWIVYGSAVKDRTAAINRFHSLTVTAPADLRAELQRIAHGAASITGDRVGASSVGGAPQNQILGRNAEAVDEGVDDRDGFVARSCPRPSQVTRP